MRLLSFLRTASLGLSVLPETMVRGGSESAIRITRSYEDTIRALNSLQTNAAVLEQIRKEKGDRTMRNSIPGMEKFLTRIGIEVNELDKLNVIHVSGTKGKGSTCAFSESILRHCGFKTGFYSSPHLVEVRERIRINGKPLDKEKFVKYFWQCMDKLEDTLVESDGAMPAYFRFLTLLSYHVFLQEKVDVAVVEVGIGGGHDCTNVIRNPVVSGIAMLGLEHTTILGGTIQQIAWHKTGIMKQGHPAVTIPQVDDAIPVFKEREKEIKAKLFMAPTLESYDSEMPVIGLEGTHQHYNASLALQLCRFWLLEKTNFVKEKGFAHLLESVEHQESETVDEASGIPVASPFFIPQPFVKGLQLVKWPGRNQVIPRKNITFYVDGAHTVESLRACKEWFSARNNVDVKLPREDIFRVLVFNSTGGRDAHTLLRPISEIDFDFAVFCPNVVEQNNNEPTSDQTNFTVTRNQEIAWCTKNQQAWLSSKGLGFPQTSSSIDTSSSHVCGVALEMSSDTAVFPSISDAIRWLACGKDTLIEKARDGSPEIPPKLAMAEHVQILVTGSLHLVGGVIKFLGPGTVELV